MKNPLTVIYTETYRVKKSFKYKIDITSAVEWQALIERARHYIDSDDPVLDELPTEPPTDLDEWLFLLYFLDGKDYKHGRTQAYGEDPSAVIEREWIIKNNKGEVLAENSSSYL
jgi:hypothetical protein